MQYQNSEATKPHFANDNFYGQISYLLLHFSCRAINVSALGPSLAADRHFFPFFFC